MFGDGVSDVHARDGVRLCVQRRAAGLTAAGVADGVEEARLLERERGRRVESEVDVRMLDRAVWAHEEWCRIGRVLAVHGLVVYDPGVDPQVAGWAAERAARAERGRQAGEEARQRRLDELDELRGDLWLNAAASRRLRVFADRYGVEPERIVHQLADLVVPGPGGGLHVEEFTPSYLE